MGSNTFEFIDNTDPNDIKHLLFNSDDILAIEKDKITSSALAARTTGQADQYIISIHTRSNLLGKKSNCLVLSFQTPTARDTVYENIRAKLNPTSFEAKWFPV